MAALNRTNKILVLVIVLIVLSLGFFVVLPYRKLWQKSSENSPQNTPVFKIANVPSSQLPKYFPAGVFMEPDAKIVENYNTDFEDGRIWATRVYQSLVPANKIQADYEAYLKSLSGWTMSKIYHRENQTFLAAAKSVESLVVTIIDKGGQTANSVTISYQTRK